MRNLILFAVVASCWLTPTGGQEPEQTTKESPTEAVFQEMLAGIPENGQRASSARVELKYWHEHQFHSVQPPVRTLVKTNDGKGAEVVFLSAPAMSMPGTDFSMAFLVVERRVVDWTSCWTYNRTAKQELMLEDVDGDGTLDVAFRASKGWWGQLDKRQHNRPGDERKWLYAYAVTSKGFQSLFPSTERDLKVKHSYDTADQPVKLQVKGLPESLRERQMVECTFSATNTSDKELAIEPGNWYVVKIDDAECLMTYGPLDKRTILKPGESVSDVLRLVVQKAEREVTIRWKFEPNR